MQGQATLPPTRVTSPQCLDSGATQPPRETTFLAPPSRPSLESVAWGSLHSAPRTRGLQLPGRHPSPAQDTPTCQRAAVLDGELPGVGRARGFLSIGFPRASPSVPTALG